MHLSVVLMLMYARVTNVTSHNPEKLHQSHLITHIHDAVMFFNFFLFFGSRVYGTCHRAVGCG